MITGAKTIKQYKILKFIDENFYNGSVEIELLDNETVKITDRKNDSMILSINEKNQIYDFNTNEILSQ